MTKETQANLSEKIDIECELSLPPHSDACRGFFKAWREAVDEVLLRNHFVIERYSLQISSDTGRCAASMIITDDSPQDDLTFQPKAGETSQSPNVSRTLGALQRSYGKSSSLEKKAIFAALRVAGSALKDPQPEVDNDNGEQPAKKIDEDGDSTKTRGTQPPRSSAEPEELVSISSKNGTARYSGGRTVHLSRAFNDNFNIDVSDLPPTYQQTTTGHNVIALEPRYEIALVRKIKGCMEKIESAIAEGDLADKMNESDAGEGDH